MTPRAPKPTPLRKLRAAFFQSASRGWFVYRARVAPPAISRSTRLNPSNPDRRLVCDNCTPGRELRSMNWFAVYCPWCGRDAVEEMTNEERAAEQRELDLARIPLALRPVPGTSPHQGRSFSKGKG